jgi:hypothetical protein
MPGPAPVPKYPGEKPRPKQGPVVHPADGLGSVSRKYESTGRPAAIGYDKSGGYSYGSYQISTKAPKGGQGSMPAFMSYLKKNAPDVHRELVNAGGVKAAQAGTKQFMDTWHNATKRDPQRFANLQHGFIKETHYDPVASKVSKIKGLDLNHRSSAIKEAIWSTSVQHGSAASKIFKRALKGKDLGKLSDKDLLRAVYAERSKVDTYFKSLPKEEREKIRQRFSRELKDLLKTV